MFEITVHSKSGAITAFYHSRDLPVYGANIVTISYEDDAKTPHHDTYSLHSISLVEVKEQKP